MLVTELNSHSDSRLLVAIDHESGGAQQAVLFIYRFMQQVPIADDARITSFRPTRPRSELLLEPDLHSYQSRNVGSRPLLLPCQDRMWKAGLNCSRSLMKPEQ
jgi:hypothetical protein